MNRYLKRALPGSLGRKLEARLESKALNKVRKVSCDASALRGKDEVSLNKVFHSEEIGRNWSNASEKMKGCMVPEGRGGVNSGDRRALYYLIRYLKPSSVLEIGTHIGASTQVIAAALSESEENRRVGSLTSVDINDVNDDVQKPWEKFGAICSPETVIDKMGVIKLVRFEKSDSIKYLLSCGNRFDLIFLDGDHSADAVYQEIPAALGRINTQGVILLHDYFPNLKPLWSDNYVIPGPYMAVERLRAEGANIEALPLGELPWATKINSNVTSLSLLVKIRKSAGGAE